MTLKTLAIFLCIFALTRPVFARTLLVSDIDDTIKISHVLNVDVVVNAGKLNHAFLGMSELYHALLASNPGMEIAYVSNAPNYVMSVPHKSFLGYNGFPSGGLYLRTNMLSQTHKLDTITDLVRRIQPSKLVMIGDNGEQDAYVYSQVQLRFPKLPSFVYIHQVYSSRAILETAKPLRLNQTGYVTSADLSIFLRKAGLLQESEFQKFIARITPQILHELQWLEPEERESIPEWVDCRDFRTAIDTENRPVFAGFIPALRSACRLP